jgi:hypothetical protein
VLGSSVMVRDGCAAFSWSNSSSSIDEVHFAKTLKLTPSERTVAPSGAVVPVFIG